MRTSRRSAAGLWPLHPAAIWPEWTTPQKRPTYAPNPRRWRRPVVIATASGLAMLAADGAFGVTLTETYLHVRNQIIRTSGASTVVEDELIIPEGGTIDGNARLAKLFGSSNAIQYPREPNNIDEDFVSSELDAYGNYGVGTSGIHFASSTTIAQATFARSYRNDGTVPEQVEIGFTIPRMETSIGGAPLHEDITARASALAFYEVRGADDRVVNEGDLFDYWLETKKAPANWDGDFDVAWQWSEDLDVLFGPAAELSYEEETYGPISATSLSVSPFSSHFVFDALNPGETATFMLIGEARLAIGPGGIEGGGQALVGDPFNLMGPDGPVFDFTVERGVDPPVTDPSVVPVPAAAWLLLSALLPILGLHRSGARQRRSVMENAGGR